MLDDFEHLPFKDLNPRFQIPCINQETTAETARASAFGEGGALILKASECEKSDTQKISDGTETSHN